MPIVMERAWPGVGPGPRGAISIVGSVFEVLIGDPD